MALSIRLSRGGAKKRPYYRIVVADARSPRDGRFIEKIGTYNPLLAKDSPERVKLDTDRAKHWLSVGAQPTDRVLRFFDAAGLKEREQVPVQSGPGSGAGVPNIDIHSDFDREAIGAPRVPFGRVGIPDDDAVALGNQPRERRRSHFPYPAGDLRCGDFLLLERDQRLPDVVVVDVSHGRGVFGCRGPDHDVTWTARGHHRGVITLRGFGFFSAGTVSDSAAAMRSGDLNAMRAGSPCAEPTNLRLTSFTCANCAGSGDVDLKLEVLSVNDKGNVTATTEAFTRYPAAAIPPMEGLFAPPPVPPEAQAPATTA